MTSDFPELFQNLSDFSLLNIIQICNCFRVLNWNSRGHKGTSIPQIILNHQKSMNSFEISLFPAARINDLSSRVFNYSYTGKWLQWHIILSCSKSIFRITFSSQPSLCNVAWSSSLSPHRSLMHNWNFHTHPHFLPHASILSLANLILTISLAVTLTLKILLMIRYYTKMKQNLTDQD